jgi:hypothetical protein
MNISLKIVIVSQGGRSHDITAHSGLSHTAGGAAPARVRGLHGLRRRGGTMAHPFIACDFEMWNDAEFRFEVVRAFVNSRTEIQNEIE